MSAHDANSRPPQDPWLAQAQATLDDSAAGLDAATLSRLNRSRQQAVGALHSTTTRRWAFAAAPVAAALLLALAMPLLRTPPASLPAPPADAVEDWALLLDGAELPDLATRGSVAVPEDPSLLEDLEFYAWLESAEGDG